MIDPLELAGLYDRGLVPLQSLHQACSYLDADLQKCMNVCSEDMAHRCEIPMRHVKEQPFCNHDLASSEISFEVRNFDVVELRRQLKGAVEILLGGCRLIRLLLITLVFEPDISLRANS